MKQSVTLILFTYLLIISCGSQPPVHPLEDMLLEGTWEETYNWQGFGDMVYPEWDDDHYEFIRSSTICLSNKQFVLSVQPHRRTFIVEPDTIYIGFAADTLYTGIYEVHSDTLRFIREGYDRVNHFIFLIDGNHLHVNVLGDIDSLGNVAIPMCSFLWASSFMKTSGTFTRIE